MDAAAWVTAIATLVLAGGVAFAAIQAYAARTAVKAQVLMRLIEEWRDPETYRSMTYVHSLRSKWKKQGAPASWHKLAEDWVQTHAAKNPNSEDQEDRQRWGEWMARRTASQFLAKMGALIQAGYLSPDEFFRVVPEAGRLLVVLWPIEKAMEMYWANREGAPLREWDRPFPKWEFSVLWGAYGPWYRSHAKECALSDFDFNGTSA